jgi:putative SOS response-associated peptidase YedK
MSGRKSMRRPNSHLRSQRRMMRCSRSRGLWETWKDKETGQKLRTFTILTTDPNELMEPIHNRMAVILHRRDYERWLAAADPSHLPIDLLRPFPAEEMKCWKVGRAVGNTRNNDPSLIEPLKTDEPASQLTLL